MREKLYLKDEDQKRVGRRALFSTPTEPLSFSLSSSSMIIGYSLSYNLAFHSGKPTPNQG